MVKGVFAEYMLPVELLETDVQDAQILSTGRPTLFSATVFHSVVLVLSNCHVTLKAALVHKRQRTVETKFAAVKFLRLL